MCHVEGEGSDTSLVALVHDGTGRRRYGRSMCSWPMYSWMRAVMHEKRFALHGHKSTDGLNVEEEIGEELLQHYSTIYTFHIGAESFMNVFFFTFF